MTHEVGNPSYIKRFMPPADVKVGTKVDATILKIEPSEYNGQITRKITFTIKNKDKPNSTPYQNRVFITYYDEPAPKSHLGQLCVTIEKHLNHSTATPEEALKALKEYGRIFVKREQDNEQQYPKFSLVLDSLPPPEPQNQKLD